MKTRNGKEKEIVLKKDGKQRMEARLVYLEPALWDQYDRLAKNCGKSRSTFIRCELKDKRRSKISNVDWSETNI
jgi:hypothetical protein